MKPDYKNWMPKGMIYGGAAITLLFLILFIIFGCMGIVSGTLKTVLFIVLLVLAVIACIITVWMVLLYRAFSYDGKRQMSKQIIEGVASYVSVPDGGKILDVGCGSNNASSSKTESKATESKVDETKAEETKAEESAAAADDAEVTITIKDNAITACEFKTYEENGTLKDENYGMADGEIKNQDYYNKAQKAIKGSEAYAKEIIGKINPDEVDSISGATYSHNQFTDAVYDALDKAAE